MDPYIVHPVHPGRDAPGQRLPTPAITAAMDPYIVHPAHPALVVQITRTMPNLPAALNARIDELWTAAAKRVEAAGAGRLFNGRIFSIDTVSPERITGHLTEYRRHVAQLEDNALFGELGIRSLAANGVLRCSGG